MPIDWMPVGLILAENMPPAGSFSPVHSLMLVADVSFRLTKAGSIDASMPSARLRIKEWEASSYLQCHCSHRCLESSSNAWMESGTFRPCRDRLALLRPARAVSPQRTFLEAYVVKAFKFSPSRVASRELGRVSPPSLLVILYG